MEKETLYPGLYKECEIKSICEHLSIIEKSHIKLWQTESSFPNKAKMKICEIWNVDKKEVICNFVEYIPLPNFYILICPCEKYKMSLRLAIIGAFIFNNAEIQTRDILKSDIFLRAKIHSTILYSFDKRGIGNE